MLIIAKKVKKCTDFYISESNRLNEKSQCEGWDNTCQAKISHYFAWLRSNQYKCGKYIVDYHSKNTSVLKLDIADAKSIEDFSKIT